MNYSNKLTLLAAGGVSAMTAISGGASTTAFEMNADGVGQDSGVSVHNAEPSLMPEECPEVLPEVAAVPVNLPEPEVEGAPQVVILPEVEETAPTELPEVDEGICWEGEAAEGYQVHYQATPINEGTSYYQVHVGSEAPTAIGLTSQSQLELKDVPYGTKGMFYNGNLIDGASALETEFGPKIQEGDIIQMAVHKKDNQTSIYFRHNGQTLGQGFSFSGKADLYPTVLLGNGASATFSQVAANYATFGVGCSNWKFGGSEIKFQKLSESGGKLSVSVAGGNKFVTTLQKDEDGQWHSTGPIKSTMMVEAPQEGAIKNLLKGKISFGDDNITFTDATGATVAAKKDPERTHHYSSENFEKLIPAQLGE